jgi:uncharacterized protein (DUF362 family)
MNKSVVSITHLDNYKSSAVSDALKKHFSLHGGLDKFINKGDRVLIKPNLIAPRSARCATQTDPAVILETAKLIKDFPATPFIADSPAWSDTQNCLSKLKILEPLKKLGVPVRQLDKPVKCNINGVKVGISSAALEADAIINLPKFKTHQQLGATFAIKNMFGCVSGKRKAWWHFRKGKSERAFADLIVGIHKKMNPVINIIDGVIAMDSQGPIRGRARPLGYIIASQDPAACELVCCKICGLSPESLPLVQSAIRNNLGSKSFDEITIEGDSLPDKPIEDFIPAALMPIRFSLPHIIKSVSKQIYLLGKNALK